MQQIRKWFKNIVTIFFEDLFGKLVTIFGKFVTIFGKMVNRFRKLVNICAWKLVSRASKQISRNLGPVWQPGV